MRQLMEPNLGSVTLTGVLYALSDPTRLEIVRSLQNDSEKRCGTFGHTKSTMSHHFKILREAGVTHTRSDGRRRLVSLRREELNKRFPGLLDAVLAAKKPI